MKSRIILKDGITEVAFIPESEWERAALHQMQAQKVSSARWRNIEETHTHTVMEQVVDRHFEPFLNGYPTNKAREQAMVVVLEEPLPDDSAKSEGPVAMPGFAGVASAVAP